MSNEKKMSLEEIKKLSDQELQKKLGLSEHFIMDRSQRPMLEKMLADYGRMPSPEELPSMEEIDKGFEEADRLEALEKQAGFNVIKSEYRYIQEGEKFTKKRIDMIRANTSHIDYDMIDREQKYTNERIASIREKIEEKYKTVNPELAALRKEERDKVNAGMNPKQAQKERREAVKKYYREKAQRGG